MGKALRSRRAILAFISLLVGAGAQGAGPSTAADLDRIVQEAIRPVMEKNGVPGMAVAVTVGGKRYFFSHGVAPRETGRKATEDTLFEIGTVSKTFTATLGSYAGELGRLSLSDPAARHLPALAGSSVGGTTLLDLGTYAAGGLPLQFPDGVTDGESMTRYFRNWRPTHPAGTHRLYSNPSIGLFGHLAARSMGTSFDAAMERKLFPMRGLARTYLHVPPERMDDYAWGTAKDGTRARVSPGVLDAETYGVKTTAADLVRFVEAHMDGAGLDAALRRAITATHTGYHRVDAMTQGLGWEMYTWPVDLARLLAGNSEDMAFKPHAVQRLAPPRAPRRDVLFNKTGSTNGFGAYVAFVPARNIGVVLLANRNYPIPDRVKAAHRILQALDRLPARR